MNMLPALHTRRDVLSKYISNADNGTIQVSEKVTALWKEKKAATEVLLGLYKNADVSESALDPEEKSKRAEYFEMAKMRPCVAGSYSSQSREGYYRALRSR